MDFQQLIHHRESIRNYNPNQPIEPEKLQRILEAGRLAPSAGNRQPWKIYLVSRSENLSKIRKCYGKPWFSDAPHVLIVAGHRSQAWTRSTDGYNSLETDLTIAMDHMILAAEAEGVGTCWIAAFDEVELKKTGFFEEDELVFAMTPLGYSNTSFSKSGKKTRKSLEEIVVNL